MLFIPTITHFYYILAIVGLGAFVSLLSIPLKAPRIANLFSHGSALIAGVYGTLFSIIALTSHTLVTVSYPSQFPLLTYTFRIDGLSAWFILIISLSTIATSIYGYGYCAREQAIHHGIFGFFFTTFIASLYTVVTANSAIFFLIAWEIMSLASYFLIVSHHHEESNVKAGFLYLIMTHVGTAFLMFALLLVGQFAGSYDFDVIRQTTEWPTFIRNVALATALIGLGIKAGIVPLHIWLPEAHPAAPSHVSALLSGVMLKLAIFMIIRFFFDFLGLPTSVWWGIVLLVIGATSALLGVLYALAEHDLKRLLAYHSVENIGIILLGVGSAGIFAGYGSYTLAGMALITALFHTLNHSIFKGLLFLGAGSVVQTTHTRNMERFGGLARILPTTTLFFLIGSLAISGLPPFNGFASEWLTFQTLLAGVSEGTLYVKALFVVAIGFLALTSGLAAACFVKAVGTTFLARARSALPTTHKNTVREPTSMVIGMGIFAFLALFFGVFASRVIEVLASILPTFGLRETIVNSTYPTIENAWVSATNTIVFPILCITIFIAVIATYILIRIVTHKQRETVNRVWACGAPAELPTFAGTHERTEITATGFARTLMVIFNTIAPTKEIKNVAHAENGIEHVHFEVHLIQVWEKYIYTPVTFVTSLISRGVRMLQSGNVNTYLLYMFVTICALLLIAL